MREFRRIRGIQRHLRELEFETICLGSQAGKQSEKRKQLGEGQGFTGTNAGGTLPRDPPPLLFCGSFFFVAKLGNGGRPAGGQSGRHQRASEQARCGADEHLVVVQSQEPPGKEEEKEEGSLLTIA